MGVTWPTCGVKGCTKRIGVTPLVSLMNPYTSKERGFLNVKVPQYIKSRFTLCPNDNNRFRLPFPRDPCVAYKGVNNVWRGRLAVHAKVCNDHVSCIKPTLCSRFIFYDAICKNKNKITVGTSTFIHSDIII